MDVSEEEKETLKIVEQSSEDKSTKIEEPGFEFPTNMDQKSINF
jgi:hypothetical protein